MKLLGTIVVNNVNSYLCVLDQTKNDTKYTVYDEYTKEDRLELLKGKQVQKLTKFNFASKANSNYVREYLEKKRVSGEVKHLPNSDNQVVQALLDILSEVKSYGYKEGNYYREIYTEGPSIVMRFEGVCDKFQVRYEMVDKQFRTFQYKDEFLTINFEQVQTRINTYKPKELVSASRTIKERVYLENVSSVSFDVLCQRYNTSWLLNEDGSFIPDYKMIETIEQFENDVMTPLIMELESCINKGEKLLLSMDTETTGLNVYNLPSGSDIKDHIVTMQISWKDEQGVLLNFDMEKFSNIPVDYTMKRLFPLVKEYIRNDRETVNTIETIDGYKVNFKRNDILVIGHNTIFDGRVSLDTGYQWFFDEDTMQMRFNLDPVGSKGKKGLKVMSKEFLGIDQWELSDTLGKGNEDKFRYIQDRRVALAYGCADSDLTRRNWKLLYSITPKNMYIAYKRYNMYTWYILAQSEYDGIRLDHNKLIERTDIVERNLKRLDDFIYSYVGSEIYRKTIIKIAKARVDSKVSNLSLEDEVKNVLKEHELKGDLPKPYKFKISGNDLKDVMYNKLEYPILNYTNKNEPAVNKETFSRLKKILNDDNIELLKEDVYTVDYDKDEPSHHNKDGSVKDDYILISKKEFNRYRFPLAYILTKYKALDKEYTGYYKPFSKGDWGGRIYKNFSTTNIETQRISNPIQTTKKDLKKMIIATDEDWYPVNWDKAQIEARVFVSEAGDYRMVNRLNDPEKDYHTENASLMFDTPAYLVSKKLRKASKSINFGLPYGLGENKMCERIHDMVVNEENILDTRMKIEAYKKVNILTWNLLESYRNSAIKEWHCSEEFKKLLGYEGRKLGHVVNASGFHRLFDLTDVKTNAQIEKVRRAAGNFPIQSFAKDIFTLSIVRLFIRLGELGLRDKFKIHMLVHDEIQCSAHKSIDPIYLMKIFMEECMPIIACKEPVVPPDFEVKERDKYMNYYIGINFGDSWYDCKQDQNECPILYVKEMVNKLNKGEYKPVSWCDKPRDIINPTMHEFFVNRIYKEFKRLQPNLDNEPINFKLILDRITNYTVRAYVTDSFKPAFKLPKDASNDLKFISCACSWAIEKFKEKDLLFEDEVYSIEGLIDKFSNKDKLSDIFDEEEDSVKSYDISSYPSYDEDDDDMDDLFEEDFSFEDDDNEKEFSFNSNFSPYDIQDDYNYNSVEEKTDSEKIFEARTKKTVNYDKINVMGDIVLVRVFSEIQSNKVEEYSRKYMTKDENNYKLRIALNNRIKKRFKVSKDIDLETLNNLVG